MDGKDSGLVFQRVRHILFRTSSREYFTHFIEKRDTRFITLSRYIPTSVYTVRALATLKNFDDGEIRRQFSPGGEGGGKCRGRIARATDFPPLFPSPTFPIPDTPYISFLTEPAGREDTGRGF